MRHAITCLLLLLWAAAPLAAKAATVSVAGATVKVRRNQAPLTARSVTISAARNEFEPFQILVTGPATGVTESAFGLSYGGIPSGHGIGTAGAAFPALRADYDRLALDHRISLSSHDDGDLSIAHFDAVYGPYVSGTAPTQTPNAALSNVQFVGNLTSTADMKNWYDHFTAKGWGERLFQYTCDEPPPTCNSTSKQH